MATHAWFRGGPPDIHKFTKHGSAESSYIGMFSADYGAISEDDDTTDNKGRIAQQAMVPTRKNDGWRRPFCSGA